MFLAILIQMMTFAEPILFALYMRAVALSLFLPVVLLYAFLVRVLTRRRRTLPAETTVQELSPV